MLLSRIGALASVEAISFGVCPVILLGTSPKCRTVCHPMPKQSEVARQRAPRTNISLFCYSMLRFLENARIFAGQLDCYAVWSQETLFKGPMAY